MNDKPPNKQISAEKEANDLLLQLMKHINTWAFRAMGNRVRSGPFRGMIIPESGSWDDGNSSAKLLGSYEHELHEAIDYATWRNPKHIINVGCAEGYYAIGFARLGGVNVIGMDTSVKALEQCKIFAEKNNVAVIVREGAETPQELNFPDLSGHRLYIIDCEGAEITLIDPTLCPELIYSDIIVECHDFMRFGASRIVADRLSETHRVELIRPRLPDLERFLEIRSPTVMSVLMALEKRPMPCYWLACWANSKRS